MFDGTVGRRPRVSMGGKKTKEQSKHEFLAAAREERAMRAQTRVFQVNSVKIQAWIRGCHVRQRTRQELHQSVMAKCKDIATLQQVYTFVVPVPVLTRLVQETIYVDRLWSRNATAPSAILKYVQQSWSLLQQEWSTDAVKQNEWALRLAGLCTLIARLEPELLVEFVPELTRTIPQTLVLWARRSAFGLFDTLIHAWQHSKLLFDVLSPLTWQLVVNHSLHANFAQSLISVPLSARQSELRPWLEATWTKLPTSTAWLTSLEQQTIVLGNLIELLLHCASSDAHVELILQYASSKVFENAWKNGENSSVPAGVNSQLELLGNHAVLMKLWSVDRAELVHAVADMYSSISVLLQGSESPLLSSIHFTTSSDAVMNRVFPLLPRISTTPSSLWLMFCGAYNNFLQTADDQNLMTHFPRLADFVGLLNQSLYSLCWLDTPAHSAALFQQLQHMVNVFNQLYIRHSRLAFCPKDAWLWPAFSVPQDIMQGLDPDEPLSLGVFFDKNSRVKLQCILTTFPQVVPFETRVSLFHTFLHLDKQHVPSRHNFSQLIPMRIQRDRIVEDSFLAFQSLESLKGRVQITFINEQGLEEAGVDGGGVFKEYIDTLTKKAFSSEYPFFLSTEERLLYPNPDAGDASAHFRFLGRLLAKAMYEEILIEPQFALFFLQKLLGHINTLDDLQSLDAQLYRHVLQLRQYPDVESLGLTFSVASGANIIHDLVPNGRNIAVTNENVIRYIHLMAHFKLNIQIASASRAFLQGFHDLIPTSWLHLFSSSELQMLIGGSTYDVNIDDWKANTNYGGGYHPSQPPIQWFWEIVSECTPQQRGDLLRFITSCSRQPLLGFKQLNPLICIQQVRIHDDERLPSSATCMNLLKLPTYSTKEIMRAKLLYAIEAKAGFELS